MAKTKQRPLTRPFLYLGVAFFAWLLIPFAWKIAFKSTFDEFHAPIWESSNRMRDLSHYWGHISDSKNTLIEKGRDHSRIISDASLQLSRRDYLEKELNNLRKIKSEIVTLENSLSLDPRLQFRPEIARVSLRNISSWSQIFEVNKGSNFKITPGTGVISSCGIVGRIKKVTNRSATVELITNQAFRIVAHIKGDDRPITFRGAGISFGRKNFGTISDVPQDIIIPENGVLEVVSSPLGGAFPGGLHIGIIKELEQSVDGLFQSAQVILSEKLNLMEEVTILSKVNE